MANDILTTVETLKSILPVFEDNIIEKIKSESPKIIEPLNDDIPMIFITGEIPVSKKYVAGELEYVSKSSRFHAYTYIKLQGTSSLSYPKKNFTINLYSDESRSVILNKEFKNWGSHNNFVLKADYIDILHARNVVSAKLWSNVVASRSDYDSLPEGLKNSPNNGAIDGFPVFVYIQGEYQGMYTLTIPKSEWLFGMSANNENHVVLSAETNDNGDLVYEFNPCNFNEAWSGVDGEDWSYEVGSNAQESWMQLYNYIYASPNATELTNYLDIQSAIDYYIFQYVILGTDGLAKNMLLLTYDKIKWYLSAYDMDSTFNLSWKGQMLDGQSAAFGEYPYLNQYSALWPFITSNFASRIKSRYIELRNGVLSKPSIINEFEKFIGVYGDDVYIRDTVPYNAIPSATENNLQNLKSFISERLDAVDMLIIGEVVG